MTHPLYGPRGPEPQRTYEHIEIQLSEAHQAPQAPESFLCLMCGRVMRPSPTVHDDPTYSPLTSGITRTAWDHGASIEIDCGFGSCFDDNTYHGVICDNCTNKVLTRLQQLKHITHKPIYQYETPEA